MLTMTWVTPRRLICLVCLGLAVITRAADQDPSPSPPAITDLICPTDNAIDCYPRIFQPTKDFQVIREGQDLPPGLHVRMDINDGTKEARLNIPMEGEAGAELEGVPVEQAMVLVEGEEPPIEKIVVEQQAMRDQVPQKPPVYEAAGKIPVPPPQGDGGDMGIFQRALLAIAMEARGFDTALDDLSELSHDIYYGVEIAKNGPVLEKLICLTLGSGTDKFPAKKENRDQKAATILASAVQNNPTALKEAADLGRIVMHPNCPVDVTEKQEKGTNNFVGIMRKRLAKEDPTAMKSKLKAISGLIKERSIRKEFLEMKGMELLLSVWLMPGEPWDGVREKVAHLVMDNFLDESMGAEIGVWPSGPEAEPEDCNVRGAVQDGCWEHHVDTFMNIVPGHRWVSLFLYHLRERRPLGPKKLKAPDKRRLEEEFRKQQHLKQLQQNQQKQQKQKKQKHSEL
jgi:nucleotide exchange factor SIL1